MTVALAGWQNFYVILGSAAGALIGLQFVVIALFASRGSSPALTAMRAYASPTIVYFTTVVVVAVLMNVPRHTRASLSLLLLLVGVVGIGYICWVAMHQRRQGDYTGDVGDLMWYLVLPFLSEVALLVAGIVCWSSARVALDVVGASAVVLLLIGVHNAWDGAVWMVADHS